jgi:two-component system sensor histidine kinase FlrB
MQAQSDGRAQQLEDAFQLFTQMSSQLEASYQVLENRVAELSAELAAARHERMRQLAEKERLANRLGRLLELLPGGVVVVDGEGRVSECNPAAVTLLGEPLGGRPWHEIIARAFEPQAEGASEVRLKSGRTVGISTRSLDPEPGQIVLLMDVTEQHALRKLVDHHQRLSAMGEMAASLAHQIRTPLSSALLYVSHLKRPDLAEDGRRRFADKALGRMRHLERMVNDMLMFARGGTFDMEDFQVERLVEGLLQTMEPQLAAAQGSMDIFNRHPGLVLRGNQEALQSALMNLATNAVQACGEGARLRLDIARRGDQVELQLHDNGPGIPDEVLERLFTPFFTTRPDGTGLGLAVVRAIVSAHQGEVWAAARPDGGSTFGVRLPAAGAGDALPSVFAADTQTQLSTTSARGE